MDWDAEIEKLKDYVFVQKLSYEEIGRIYNCTGSNIKKGNEKKRYRITCQIQKCGEGTC